MLAEHGAGFVMIARYFDVFMHTAMNVEIIGVSCFYFPISWDVQVFVYSLCSSNMCLRTYTPETGSRLCLVCTNP